MSRNGGNAAEISNLRIIERNEEAGGGGKRKWNGRWDS